MRWVFNSEKMQSGRRRLRSSVGTRLALAESLCRAGDWIHSSGVPRSCDRVPRTLATKNAPIALRVLPPIENASFVGKGRAGATSDSAAGNGDRRGPFRRSVGCITATNDELPERAQIHHATRCRLGFGNLCLYRLTCGPVHQFRDSSRAVFCLSLGFNYGYNIYHGLYGILARDSQPPDSS